MTKQPVSLLGSTVLITGSAGFLGAWHAEAILAANGSVVLTDLSEVRLQALQNQLRDKFPNQSIISLRMDVTSQESILNVLNSVSDRGIDINVLINNAAIDPKVSKDGSLSHSEGLENFSISEWDQQISVGLTGAAICTKIFGTQMASRGGGVIINVGSDLSVIAPDQRIYNDSINQTEWRIVKPVAYSVVKTGLLGLTRYTATYWAHRNVRCNMLSPGPIFSNQATHVHEELIHRIPLARLADPSEIGGAIVFLCSDMSSYLNGHNLILDGGRTIW